MSQLRGPHASVLAQADQLAAAGRSSDAEALYRFAIDVDPGSAKPRIGLARAVAGRGETDRAVDELVESARELAAASKDTAGIFAMFGLALELAPDRLELHVDLAEVQAANGDVLGAQTRLAQLSMAYVQAGRPDDARDVLAFANAWDAASPIEGGISGAIDEALPLEESIPILLDDLEEHSDPHLRVGTGVPATVDRTATICTPTLLRDPSGALLPNQTIIPAPPVDRDRITTPKRPRPAVVSVPRPRTKTGRARKLPTSKTALRTLRARAKVRSNAAPEGSSLARRLRKLGGLPK